VNFIFRKTRLSVLQHSTWLAGGTNTDRRARVAADGTGPTAGTAHAQPARSARAGPMARIVTT